MRERQRDERFGDERLIFLARAQTETATTRNDSLRLDQRAKTRSCGVTQILFLEQISWLLTLIKSQLVLAGLTINR